MKIAINKLKQVALHPATIKYLKQGHFWATMDSFTKKFPKNELFLLGMSSDKKSKIGVFIQDEKHKNIKARFFHEATDFDFYSVVKNRISDALKKRIDLKLFAERENVLLVNGENDFLPGLFIILLKDRLILQYYAHFWEHFEKELVPIFIQELSFILPDLKIEKIYIQDRNLEQKKSWREYLKGELLTEDQFVLKEFNVQYKIKISPFYDYGIYTDMSSIRKHILPFLKDKKSALNLYCYTGAYSIFLLSNGLESVTSVDLSAKYLDWLNENINLNPKIDANKHQSMCMSADKALTQLKASNQKFDIIVCDPPSSSSDGNKRTNALDEYEKSLIKMLDLLEDQGTLFIFLNTHQISYKKFEEKIIHILTLNNKTSNYMIKKKLKLGQDYLPQKGFLEGDYLKGVAISKVK